MEKFDYAERGVYSWRKAYSTSFVNMNSTHRWVKMQWSQLPVWPSIVYTHYLKHYIRNHDRNKTRHLYFIKSGHTQSGWLTSTFTWNFFLYGDLCWLFKGEYVVLLMINWDSVPQAICMQGGGENVNKFLQKYVRNLTHKIKRITVYNLYQF
jgi:hypothetical protein